MRKLRQISGALRTRPVWRIIQVALVALVVVFAGRYLLDQWSRLQEHPLAINWPVLVAAQVAVFAGLSLMALPNLMVLKALDADLPLLVVLRVWFLSNIAKYLPGSIWALPGRMFLYQREGVGVGRSVVVVFWEVLALVMAAGLVALLAWPLVAAYVPVLVMLALAACALAGMGMVFTLIHSRRWRGRALRLPMPDRLKSHLMRDELWPSTATFVKALGVAVGCWLLIGLGMGGMVYAINPAFDSAWWPQIAGLYAGAWLVGFLIVFTPGGIGIRDALIGLGISVILSDPLPALVAILARILWTVAEIVGVLAFNMLYARYATTNDHTVPE